MALDSHVIFAQKLRREGCPVHVSEDVSRPVHVNNSQRIVFKVPLVDSPNENFSPVDGHFNYDCIRSLVKLNLKCRGLYRRVHSVRFNYFRCLLGRFVLCLWSCHA